jgi:dynein heavy chain
VNEEQKTVLSTVTRSALFTTLRQEIDRFNQLLGVISETTKQLRLAVSGNSLMTDSLDEMYAALLKHKVPQSWKVRVC